MANIPEKLGGALLTTLVAAAPLTARAEDGLVEEVIVTAQKRSERLVDVPISIAVLDSQVLEERRFTNIQDLALMVPGMTMREEGPGSYTIFMRGISNQYGFGAVVGVYLDEALLTLTGFDQLDTRFYDLERVEVLKGPQGTLYGQGAIAGAVRYITKKPVLDRFEGHVDGSIASVSGGSNKETVTGVVNVPLVTDKFAIRLGATREQGGGWQDHPLAGIYNGNDQDLLNARVKALWQITDNFTADAMVVVHRNEVQLGQGFENPDRTITVGVDRSHVLIPKKFDYDLYNLNLNYDFGGAQLISSTSYTKLDHSYPHTYIAGLTTFDQGRLEGYTSRIYSVDQWSQEVRLASSGDGRLDWTVGAFYRDMKRPYVRTGMTLRNGVTAPQALFIQNDTYKSSSVFADAAWRLTDRLSIGSGVRYFYDDQTSSDGTTYAESETFDSVDPRVYANFKLNDDTSIYASVAKGFRSGGFNRGTQLPNYEPEKLIAYELGAKGSLWDRRVSFEAAVFYNDYKDMLRRGLVYVPELNLQAQNTTNIGKVETTGFEAGLSVKATRQLSFSGTVALLDSEIVAVSATDGTSKAGDPVDYVPDISYTLGARYEFDLTGGLPGFVRLDYSYRDKVTYIDRTSFLPQYLPQESDDIALLDGRIGVAWNGLSVELFGANLTNQNKWLDPYYGWLNANRTRPRTLGVQIGYDFK